MKKKGRQKVAIFLLVIVACYAFLCIVDAVRSDYDIEVSGYVSETISREQRDLCTVSSNLIRNAVEAVKKLEHGIIFVDSVELIFSG